ncbi:hypothetical protein [Micromonospora sp. NPDC048898]
MLLSRAASPPFLVEPFEVSQPAAVRTLLGGDARASLSELATRDLSAD